MIGVLWKAGCTVVEERSWTVRQRECIDYAGPHLLVTGPPGTGKTLVLLKRALRLRQTAPDARVLVVTYNKTLAQYAGDQLRLNGADDRVTVTHFHRWAYRWVAKTLGRPPQVIAEADRLAVVRRLVDAARPTGGNAPAVLSRPLDWWRDEVDWMKGNALVTWEQYLQAERSGRGQGLHAAARQLVWQVFAGYQEALDRGGLVDFRDFALVLLRAWTPTPDSARVTHLLIDEAQDLRPADLRVLMPLARESTTVVADRSQKIYSSSFAWRDLGFEVRGGGRAKRLTKSYRTTREVARLAASLRQRDPLVRQGDPDFVEHGTLVEEEAPDREGPLPVVIATRDAQHETLVVLRLLSHLLQEPLTVPTSSAPLTLTLTIGILARTWETLGRLEPALRARQFAPMFLRDEGAAASPGVKLVTFHAAKGLEFDAVLVVGLSEGLFPPPLGPLLVADEGELEADVLSIERRLLYVAMTRTRGALYLLHGQRPSRFLAELDPTCFRRTAPELSGSDDHS